MKIVYIGCVESSLKYLQALSNEKEIEIVGIVTKIISATNSDHVSLVPYAEELGVDWLDFRENKELEEWIRAKKPDLIYCFGWSHILPKSIIDIPECGAIGYHPSLLPANRGRHPIIWAIALGLNETGSTFFYMSEGADEGDILNQKVVPIDIKEDAGSLYEKVLNIGSEQVVEMTKQLISKTLNPIKQNQLNSNNWRKRSKLDGQIDWRMSTDAILRLIRALTKPYIGAHAVYKGEDFIIWKAEEVVKYNATFDNFEPGKVVATDGNTFIVKTDDSLIKIVEHEWKTIPTQGEYL